MDIPWGAQGKWYLHRRWVFNINLNVLQATVISAIYAELQTNTSMAGLSVVRLFEPSESTFSGIWTANLCTSETLAFCLLLGNSWYWVWFESLKHHQCLISNILQSTRRIKLPKRTCLRVAPETVEAGRDSVGTGFSCVQQYSIYNYIHGFIVSLSWHSPKRTNMSIFKSLESRRSGCVNMWDVDFPSTS